MPTPTTWTDVGGPGRGRTCAPCCWSWSRARAACSLWTGTSSAPWPRLCEQRDWLLLVDEVQTGIGRTGTLFAFQQYGIRPDAVSFAKGIAGGLPMGGFLANEKCRQVPGPRQPRLHLWRQPRLLPRPRWRCWTSWTTAALNRVREKGAYLREQHRGNGQAMPGCHPWPGPDDRGGGPAATGRSRELAAQLAGHGLLVPHRRARALRLLPPLTITKGEMDQGLAILDTGPGVTPGCARHFCMR